MKRMFVKVKLEETALLKKAKQAKEAIRELREFAKEFEFFNKGSSMGIEANQQNAIQENETTTAFFVEINEEVVKDQVAAVEAAMKPLMDAIEKLDKAIIEGLSKSIPQE